MVKHTSRARAAAPAAQIAPIEPAAETPAPADIEHDPEAEADEPPASEGDDDNQDDGAEPKVAEADKPVEAPLQAGEVAWLEMKTGLSGPAFSLSPGDKYPFDNEPGPDGAPSEAQRLVDAGYARFSSPPED